MTSATSVISRSAQRFFLANSKGNGWEEGGEGCEGICVCMKIVAGEE